MTTPAESRAIFQQHEASRPAAAVAERPFWFCQRCRSRRASTLGPSESEPGKVSFMCDTCARRSTMRVVG